MAREYEGQITGSAWIDGREMSLDGVPMKGMKRIMLPRRRVETALAAGFRVDWLDGKATVDGSDVEFDLTAGAGVGSPYLILTVKVDGDRREEIVDMAEVVRKWVAAVLAEGPTPKPETNEG